MSPEDVPPPRRRADLVGHGSAAATLQAAADGGTLHHGWVLAGPRGIGKATLAFRLARYVLAGPRPAALFGAADDGVPLDLSPDDPVFRRVGAGGHSDLMVLESAGARGEISVGAVRDAIRFLHLTPGEGDWRVLIVDGADTMNANAQNAVLKILEEPPARTLIILVAHRPARLLPTVRSRCRRLALAPLDRAGFDRIAEGFLPDFGPEERTRLFEISAGSPGMAMEFAHLGGLDLHQAIAGIFAGLPEVGRADLARIAEAVSADREPAVFRVFARLLTVLLAARMRRQVPTAARLQAEERVTHLLEAAVGLTLDRRQVVTDIFATLAKAEGTGPA